MERDEPAGAAVPRVTKVSHDLMTEQQQQTGKTKSNKKSSIYLKKANI